MPRDEHAVRSFAVKYANAAINAVRAQGLPVITGMRASAYAEGRRRAEVECEKCNVSQGVADEAVAVLEELLKLDTATLTVRGARRPKLGA